ncbi:MAG: hypothetical protein IJD65_05415 [Mailhella sp.]|nr:hypothetical protein [Mailhella sp.]
MIYKEKEVALNGAASFFNAFPSDRSSLARLAAFFSKEYNSLPSPERFDALGRRAAEGVPDSQSASEQGGSAKRERALRTRLASSGGQLTKRTEQGARRAQARATCFGSEALVLTADFRQKIQDIPRRELSDEGMLAKIARHLSRSVVFFLTLHTFKAASLSREAASFYGVVTPRFAFTPVSKAALRAWPLIRHTDCAAAFQGNDFQSLGFSSRKSAFPRMRAGEEERQREMPFAPSRPRFRAPCGFVASLGF